MSNLSEKVCIVKEQWDYLIILDACRYDYFEAVYKQYINGDLQKRISAGSCTNDWRDANFPDKYDDIVYISANPFFAQNQTVLGYNAGDHFHKVYELWKDGWQRGTVLPEYVTKVVPEIIKKHPGKRFVIHYLQPHAPYLVLGEDAIGYEDPQGAPGRKLAGQEDYSNAPKYKKKILKWLIKLFQWNNILGNYPDWHLRNWLGLPHRSSMEYIVREYNKKVLRNAYKQNLKMVLEQTAILLEYLQGSIVVSADHGELLGESRCYAHPPKSNNPLLLEVPWLVIKQNAAKKQLSDPLKAVDNTQRGEAAGSQQSDDNEEIQQRLRALGYFE